MTHSDSVYNIIANDSSSCEAALLSPVLTNVFVCGDLNSECTHSVTFGSTCYCANHQNY
jgi:hypothetical protein